MTLQKICGPEYNTISNMNTGKDNNEKSKKATITPRVDIFSNGKAEIAAKETLKDKVNNNVNIQKLNDLWVIVRNRIAMKHFFDKWIKAYMQFYLKGKIIINKILLKSPKKKWIDR